MVCFLVSRTEKMSEVFVYMFVFKLQTAKTTKV